MVSGITVVTTVLVLLSRLASGTSLVTLTVLVRLPNMPAFTVTVMLKDVALFAFRGWCDPCPEACVPAVSPDGAAVRDTLP